MIELIYMVISFLLLWVPAFILHELMHAFEAWIQGCKTKIEMWLHNGIPSMRCTVIEGELSNKKRFALAGGFYSGIILILLSCATLSIPWLSASLGVLGIINLIYSIYECLFLYEWSINKYMKYHYIIYIIGGIIGILLYSNLIKGVM